MIVTAPHNDLVYEEIAVPQSMVRALFPRNTFHARLTEGHAEITISTDLAGIPAVKEKLEALAVFMAISMQQPDIIVKHSVEAPSVEDAPNSSRLQTAKEPGE